METRRERLVRGSRERQGPGSGVDGNQVMGFGKEGSGR